MPKPVILAVDDDPQVLRALVRDLNQTYGKDYRIVRTDSAAAALAVLQDLDGAGDPVALIVSDQRMPQLDGVRFLTEARRLYPEAKRVLLTAYADTDAAIHAINHSQVDYYLLKPWDPPEERLYPVLGDLLSDWRAHYRPGYADAVRIVGTRWAPEIHELKEFLSRHQAPYVFLDVEADGDDAREVTRVLAAGGTESPRLPLVVLPNGTRLEAPTLAEVATGIGLKTRSPEPFYKVAIVGGGPAGLAAAVYAASEGLSTVLIERDAPGGQAGASARIENYLGFPNGVSGADLTRRAFDQARRFKVEAIASEVQCIRIDGPYKHLTLGDGTNVSCHVLMLTMGLSWQKLPAVGADRLSGRGIYYGSAATEALNCRGCHVYIVGAGNSAAQAAVHLAQSGAGQVTMLVRGRSLSEKMSQYLVDRIENGEIANIDVRTSTEVLECHGDERLDGLTLVNRLTGVSEKVETSFLFVFIGAVPRTEWLKDIVARDRHGFILTGPDLDPARDLDGWPLERAPYLLEASVPGIFAAGDVRHESIKRVASAVGEGSVAVHFIHRHLAAL